ncbi:polymer-forming cytoskeletal protein [Polynucleobacter sp. AP-Elch-400A-B2]|uniref:bactofilin family protein n=1 Tax=Polynucleobacter sp. AP-Elch-400A-B2 TaxID=2576930 RepID=UPI001BFEE7B6|nr:polymer-forming cytoskeletal protein [Polynucleobacter sp. AP-Elch-400A-B2]QWE25541.1 polymer-forming cytoskeletal protein [Polynucleobacter sp. AP-Elch-400A-B2]
MGSLSNEGLPQSNELIKPIQGKPAVPAEENSTQMVNLAVGKGVCLRGSFNAPNKTIVAGLIEGNLITKELLVKEYGEVQGQVDCQLADIAGYVENDLQIHIALTLRASAVITGNIFLPRNYY